MTEGTAQAAAPAAAPITVASAVAANQPISRETAIAALRNSRAAQGDTGTRPDPARTDAPKGNPFSDAGRKLNDAKKAKAAQPSDDQGQSQVQESSDEDASTVEDDSQEAGQTRDEIETADDESPGEAESTEGQDDAAEQPIDLGDGVKVTKDEIRDSFMLKADHTKKTQALAEYRKSIETGRTQEVRRLEAITAALQKAFPVQTLSALQTAHGPELAIQLFEQQGHMQDLIRHAAQSADESRANTRREAEASRDAELAELYNKDWSDPHKRGKAYTDLTAYAVGLGATAEDLGSIPKSWFIQVLDKASKYDASQKAAAAVKRTIADKPKITKPGARVSQQSAHQRGISDAHAKLKSSGNLADAVALMRAIRSKAGAR